MNNAKSLPDYEGEDYGLYQIEGDRGQVYTIDKIQHICYYY